jgi:S-adenosylmethionine/arginine decarboxylase-like enzyme
MGPELPPHVVVHCESVVGPFAHTEGLRHALNVYVNHQVSMCTMKSDYEQASRYWSRKLRAEVYTVLLSRQYVVQLLCCKAVEPNELADTINMIPNLRYYITAT